MGALTMPDRNAVQRSSSLVMQSDDKQRRSLRWFGPTAVRHSSAVDVCYAGLVQGIANCRISPSPWGPRVSSSNTARWRRRLWVHVNCVRNFMCWPSQRRTLRPGYHCKPNYAVGLRRVNVFFLRHAAQKEHCYSVICVCDNFIDRSLLQQNFDHLWLCYSVYHTLAR